MKKNIPGYDGYTIDINGIVYTKKGQQKYTRIGNTGYRMVALQRNDGKSMMLYVHRLMMLAFEGPSELQVNHINEDRLDNRLSNLEYVTAYQNYKHTEHKHVNPEKPVLQLSKDGKLIKRYKSASETKKWGFSRGCVNDVCLGKRKTHKKYIWQYEQ